MVVEHASTVWCTTAVQQRRLEQVQTRVLRRLTATRENLADDFLRCELACRHTVRICQQRQLEFAFELLRMPASRLPALVAKCDWGRNLVVSGIARPKLHSDVVASVASAVGQQPAVAAAAPEVTAGEFKKAVRDYLRILGPTVTSFPNTLP